MGKIDGIMRNSVVEKILSRIPTVAALRLERDAALSQFERLKSDTHRFVPPGHYYSPLPSIEEIRRYENRIFDGMPSELPGIDLNERSQVELLRQIARFYHEIPYEPIEGARELLADLTVKRFQTTDPTEIERLHAVFDSFVRSRKSPSLRFWFENFNYGFGDAVLLFCMLRHLQPRRIVEIGAGFSSALILDTNELFFDHSVSCTFIDPDPELFLSLLKPGDRERIRLLPLKLQDVDCAVFSSLGDRDVLFVDSSHVSKVFSDVNLIFFEILPLLQPGVYVHFHDVFHPFEYPKEWVYEGRAWNEMYILRAFLQYNTAFKTALFSSFLQHFHLSFFKEHLPLCLHEKGGQLWLLRM